MKSKSSAELNHDEMLNLRAELSAVKASLAELHDKFDLAGAEIRKIWGKLGPHFASMANLDEVTQLPNQTLFLDRLDQGILRAKREISVLGLLVFHLSGINEINESSGRAVGDKLLEEIAEKLSSCFRETDSIARLGNDEFAVILPAISKYEDAAAISEKIIAALSNSFEIQGQAYQIGASIGIGLYPTDGSSMEKLLHNTTVAMEISRQRGNNNFTYFAGIPRS